VGSTLSTIISLVVVAWHIYLAIVGARWARNVTYGQGAGACALSCVGCVGLLFVTILAIGLLGGLLFGGA
jgi:hypothetical protein